MRSARVDSNSISRRCCSFRRLPSKHSPEVDVGFCDEINCRARRHARQLVESKTHSRCPRTVRRPLLASSGHGGRTTSRPLLTQSGRFQFYVRTFGDSSPIDIGNSGDIAADSGVNANGITRRRLITTALPAP